MDRTTNEKRHPRLRQRAVSGWANFKKRICRTKEKLGFVLKNRGAKYYSLFCCCDKVNAINPFGMEKKIEILVKDKYDEKYGIMLEYGIVEPLEYYKTKKLVIELGIMV